MGAVGKSRNTDLIESIFGEKVDVNEGKLWSTIQDIDANHPMKVAGRGWFDLAWRRYVAKQTYREIGEMYGVSTSRVVQMDAKLLRLLRHPSRTQVYRRIGWD